MSIGVLELLSLAKRFWFVPVGIAIAFAFMAMRADIAGKTAELAKDRATVANLTETNKVNAAVIEQLKQTRVDNDAIATAVAAKLGTNTVRETNTRTIIEKAKHDDPQVRAWADLPIPSGVRRALQAR